LLKTSLLNQELVCLGGLRLLQAFGDRNPHLSSITGQLCAVILEISVIRTPHIGGVIEIFAVAEDRLVIQAELSGYSSQQIGSRSLDSSLAADFDGDGKIEIVVPDQSQTVLAGIQSFNDELEIVWEAPVGERLSTNMAAVLLSDGRLALAVIQEAYTLAQTILRLAEMLSSSDTIIYGGNSNYKDTQRCAQILQDKGLEFINIGTSGGIWGLA
jgi:hypothetical protein